MAKATKQTPATPATPATVRAAKLAAAAARATGKQAPADEGEGDEGEGDEGEGNETGRRQWARELARNAAAQGNACRRCYALALALATAIETAKTKPGATLVVSFAKANELANLQRGARGNPVASWRLAVQRMRQALGGADAIASQYGFAVEVDADAGSLVCTKVA